MSKTTETTGKKKISAAPRAEVGPAMAGCDILVQALEREGVEVIFAYPGGASMEIHQSLTKSKIRTILPRHEQGGSFAAEGYGRRSRVKQKTHDRCQPWVLVEIQLNNDKRQRRRRRQRRRPPE